MSYGLGSCKVRHHSVLSSTQAHDTGSPGYTFLMSGWKSQHSCLWNMIKSFSDKSQILLRAGVRCSFRRQPAPLPLCVLPCQVCLDARQPQHTKCSSSGAGTCGFYHVTKSLRHYQVLQASPSQSLWMHLWSRHIPTWHCQFSLPQPYMLSYFCQCSSVSFIHSSLWAFWGSFHADNNATGQHSLAWHILYFKHQGAWKAGRD